MKFIKLFIVTVFFLSLINPSYAGAPKKLKVVATFSILGDLVKNVVGDNAELHILVGPNGDAHTFEPTPKDALLLKQADVIFEIGLGFEPWLDDLYASSKSKAQRVKVSEGIDLIKSKDNSNNIDPHIWHDVKNAIQMVGKISQGMISMDPSHQDQYTKFTDVYVYNLNSLDLWIKGEVSQLPEEQRKLVTSHDTFQYFSRGYGFKLIASAINSATTEASDPSAKDMADLVRAIREEKVKMIFAENIKSAKLLKVIAEEAKVSLAPALYTDALGESYSDGDTYFRMMQWNVKTIVEGLKK